MKVTLYTKAECGLCAEAEATLIRMRKKTPFDLELVDIEGDPVLYNRYWDRVPVVVVEGKEEVAAPLSESRLRALLSV